MINIPSHSECGYGALSINGIDRVIHPIKLVAFSWPKGARKSMIVKQQDPPSPILSFSWVIWKPSKYRWFSIANIKGRIPGCSK